MDIDKFLFILFIDLDFQSRELIWLNNDQQVSSYRSRMTLYCSSDVSEFHSLWKFASRKWMREAEEQVK